MATVTLGQLRDLWKSVSDWVTGASASEPKVVLSGRKEASITEELTTTPLGAGASYTSPSWDVETYEFPNGSVGIVSISALATSDKQGTLYLEGSNDNTKWHRIHSVAVNNTGVGRMRRTNVFTRYIRLRFVNGPDAQTEFSLSYSLWQVTDGQGDQYGQGADVFTRLGLLGIGVTETVMDIRSAVELQEIIVATDSEDARLDMGAYKDDGTRVQLSYGLTTNGVARDEWPSASSWNAAILSLFEPTPLHDPSSNKYSIRLRPGPGGKTMAKGVRLRVINGGTADCNVGVYVLCRLL